MSRMPDPEIPPFLYGTAWKEERTSFLVEQALRAGFRGVDTANQRKHYFEVGVGQGLAEVFTSGVISRDDVFLQTKFTYQRGQDHRLPYDPGSPLSVQVAQSMASSLDHLRTDCIDSYILHGPSSNYGWTDDDGEVWEAMRKERDAGRTRMLGVSNVALHHLQLLENSGAELPSFVQNRCFAQLGWDREVRSFCREHNVIYQGFSLLTANRQVLEHPPFITVAKELNATPAQVIFAFARTVGILPLTGTSSPEHMKQDLASLNLTLPPELVKAIESIAG
jgi:diketogulonate reductase-like aldo/keto reductase